MQQNPMEIWTCPDCKVSHLGAVPPGLTTLADFFVFDIEIEEEVQIKKNIGPEDETQGTGGGVWIEGLGPRDDTQGSGRDPSPEPGPST